MLLRQMQLARGEGESQAANREENWDAGETPVLAETFEVAAENTSGRMTNSCANRICGSACETRSYTSVTSLSTQPR